MLIHETFQNTVQGEGYWSGTPCDFIRIYGCPVRCPWCDTGYSEGGEDIFPVEMSIETLVRETQSKRVVISGGEPFFSKDLWHLITALREAGKDVSIETSGANWKEVPAGTWITLSPKAHINPRFSIDARFWEVASEIKLVISDGNEVEFYQEQIERALELRPELPIFFQPEAGGGNRTIALCLNMLKLYPHLRPRLSLQTHKLIGVR